MVIRSNLICLKIDNIRLKLNYCLYVVITKLANIALNKDKLRKVYQETVKDKGTTLGKQKNKINDLYKESSLQSASTRQKNAQERLSDENTIRSNFSNMRDSMLVEDSFIKNNKKLVNNLISNKANSIQLTFLDEEVSPFEGDDE